MTTKNYKKCKLCEYIRNNYQFTHQASKRVMHAEGKHKQLEELFDDFAYILFIFGHKECGKLNKKQQEIYDKQIIKMCTIIEKAANQINLTAKDVLFQYSFGEYGEVIKTILKTLDK